VFEEAIWAHDLAGSLSGALRLAEAELQRTDDDEDAPTRRLHRLFVRSWALDELGREESEPRPPSFDAAVEQAAQAPRTPMFVRLLARLVWASRVRSQADRLSPLLEEAAEVVRSQGTPTDRASVDDCRANLLMMRGNQDEAAETYLQRLSRARADSPVSLVVMWETNEMYRLSVAGRFRDAVELGLVTIRRLGSPLLARRSWNYVCGALAWSLIELGRWREADEFLTQTMASAIEGIHSVSLELQAGLIQAYVGDTDSAARALAGALTATSEPGVANTRLDSAGDRVAGRRACNPAGGPRSRQDDAGGGLEASRPSRGHRPLAVPVAGRTGGGGSVGVSQTER
jgi:hypothetical protein